MSDQAIDRSRLEQRASAHDAANVQRYGSNAPRWCELLWVNPAGCVDTYGSFTAGQSGEVIGGDWDQRTYRLERNPIAAACMRHWRDGVSWEEAGAYDLQLERISKFGSSRADGLRTREHVVRRYQELDVIFETVRAEGRLRPRSETDGFTVRERDGILIHVASDARPVFGHRGVHRFAMALILQLPTMPAQIGVVHPDALPVWRRKFRTE
jgi:hypothetical protein